MIHFHTYFTIYYPFFFFQFTFIFLLFINRGLKPEEDSVFDKSSFPSCSNLIVMCYFGWVIDIVVMSRPKFKSEMESIFSNYL
jgi:hypothetical protein